ncbi:MAG TPA: NADH-quinone oxidoreductase subunit J [Burkholderiales bacterium]|nr:NADH-quinone oxidoreductase subunit J [Burkholderiales bacterium]
MEFKTLLFYFFSVILVVAALAVVLARNPVHSAMFLVLSFFTAAYIWMLLEAEFLAITLVLVYIGAVMVLFLFVVMMLDINLDRLREGFWRWFPVGALVAAIMVVEIVMVLLQPFGAEGMPAPAPQAVEYSNTKALGRLIYTEYVYAFEIAAVILLVAIVAAIALTLRRRPGTKHQDPARQVLVRRGDRVRLVSVPPESRD